VLCRGRVRPNQIVKRSECLLLSDSYRLVRQPARDALTRLREREALVYSVGSFAEQYSDSGLLGVYLVTDHRTPDA